MNIGNTTPAVRDTQASGSAALSPESRRISDDVAQARNTAMSALNNDRFRVMLEQIGNPQSSGDLVTMAGNGDSNAQDFRTAQSRYAENSE
ncbi:hypothetical protein FJV76_18055 [Mesorhizobium sp. WSM4303]|uniref:hypothetical protein n=1 Tax=unclassified Mesorhizobium TaxID=325217 RepID=UPI00115CCA1C|nr:MULTISPECIES: hypothetical protein [unclassified Mesorhizobium]TRD00628.1 hypothetical protein FJV77_02005 [Mesorhizobium sp. WSM4306]TRD02764.1 hypothetical protein FJV76_18055 [Mesorhizobium sp. WSM4303]